MFLEPRRAAVALILRVIPSSARRTSFTSSPAPPPPPTLADFFALDWINEPGVTAEILFLRRDFPQSEKSVAQNRPRNTEDAHVAFPGGRMEEGDEGGLYTGMNHSSPSSGINLLISNPSYATNMGRNRN